MPEWCFLIFWIFFAIFFSEFSCLGRVWTEFGTKIFYLFFILSHPVSAKNNVEKSFLIFWIFLLFFSEFSCPGQVWTEFGTKTFFLFLGLSLPVLAKNNAEKRFFKIFEFFCYFFRNFLAWVEYERISDLNFFPYFSAYLIPFWLKIMLEIGFLIF